MGDEGVLDCPYAEHPVDLRSWQIHDLRLVGFLQLEDGLVVGEEQHVSFRCHLDGGGI